MTKNHRKNIPKNVNQVVDFSKTFPEGYSKKSYEKRWMNLKKGFAETPDTGFRRKTKMNNLQLSAIASLVSSFAVPEPSQPLLL